jgi:hypothetical protein
MTSTANGMKASFWLPAILTKAKSKPSGRETDTKNTTKVVVANPTSNIGSQIKSS